ncbi:MAG: hypothetical protein P9X24_08020 [Candidatus Hatepunaea meridiana]|nr:hypothetical protein [Candidatus Hatepunaea meridiana]
MRPFTHKWRNDDGWTFIEATLTVVIMAIMVLGLTIVLMAFREHLDRSWAIRVMDQYGNDVIEELTHELRNAIDVSTRPSRGNTHEIDVVVLDKYYANRTSTVRWRADLRTTQIKRDNEPVDLLFPPRQLGRGESYEIRQFTLTKYGVLTPNIEEHRDSQYRSDSFNDATFDIRFILRYNRLAINPGERNWNFEKAYFSRVYMRNKNLPIRMQVTE